MKVIKFERPEAPKPIVTPAMRHLAEMLLSGEVTGYGIAIQKADGNLHTSSYTTVHSYEVLGAVEAMKIELVAALIEESAI